MKVEKNAVIKDPRILGVFILVVLGLLIYFVFTQKAKATFTPNWSPWSSCQHLDGKKGLWKYRRCLVGNSGPVCSWGQLGSYQYEECPKPTNTPTPTLAPTATPTPTEQPKQGCGEGYVEVEEECVPVPTPTREPEPTPRPEPGPASAPEQPACKDIRYVPTITGVGRLDSDSIWITWTKVEDYVNKYLVWYGPSKDLLIWNTFVDGERAEIHHLWPNSHTWVKVAGTHEGCIGDFSATVDP